LKKILITGANSYIGTSLENWLYKESDKYIVDTVDMRSDSWKEKDFSEFDVVFHVAGIVHVKSGSRMKDLHYKINRDLAIETAIKAKTEGVKQFIFMSSMSVYGDSSNKEVIDQNTLPTPSNFYGKSKLQAEEGIKPLEDNGYKVVILRPPMIYGKGCKGNYPKLAKAAQKLPIFPDIDNQRSMLHIDNFCEFVKLMIDYEESGVFFPQNAEYMKTSEMVKVIAKAHAKKVKLTKIFNPLLELMNLKIGLINKVFGNLVYEKSMSDYKINYRIWDLEESIKLTERKS